MFFGDFKLNQYQKVNALMQIVIIHFICIHLTEQRVLAKRQIPLHMKFGPVVGDAKQLNNQQMQTYRELNSDYPLLFLSANCVLDVSNQSKF